MSEEAGIAPAVQIRKAGEAKKKSPEAPKEPVVVEGKAQALVQLSYGADNHHWLNHVHSISRGLNHVPADVWEKAKEHPTTRALLGKGTIVELGHDEAKPEAEEETPEEQVQQKPAKRASK